MSDATINTTPEPGTHRRPPFIFESRAATDFARMLLPLAGATVWPRRRRSAAPIMVVPGFGADDGSTLFLRHFLRQLGYRAEGWGMGRNLAGVDLRHEARDISDGWQIPDTPDYRGEGGVALLCDRLTETVGRRVEKLGQPMTLIGWSLGGYLAREVARDLPDAVDHVITMGSPVVGGPKYTAAADYFLKRGLDLDWIEREIEKRERNPITQPITAIYSKSDAVVSWPAAIDRFSANVRHIEIDASHLGMGFNPEVWRSIEEALESATARARP